MRTENKRRIVRFCCDYPEAVLDGKVWVNHATGRVGPKYELIKQAVDEGWLEFDPINRGYIVDRPSRDIPVRTIPQPKHGETMLVFSVPTDKVHIVRNLVLRILGYAEHRHHE